MSPNILVGDIVYVAGDEWRYPWIVETVNSRYEGVVSFADIRSTHQTLQVPLYSLHLFPERDLARPTVVSDVKQLRGEPA
jgi:hypothetical protein